MFSFEYFVIFKNSYFYKTSPVADSKRHSHLNSLQTNRAIKKSQGMRMYCFMFTF